MQRHHRVHNALRIASGSSNAYRSWSRLFSHLRIVAHRMPSVGCLAFSDGIVVIHKPHVSQSPAAETTGSTHTPHELGIALGSLVFGVAGEHTLDRHAYTLNALDGRPSSCA